MNTVSAPVGVLMHVLSAAWILGGFYVGGWFETTAQVGLIFGAFMAACLWLADLTWGIVDELPEGMFHSRLSKEMTELLSILSVVGLMLVAHWSWVVVYALSVGVMQKYVYKLTTYEHSKLVDFIVGDKTPDVK